ncbi:MAG: hypothetical protein ABIG34_01500 [Candidatus Peregrinibacteria bacterium]
MATIDRPTDGARKHPEHGNGFDPYLKWFNIPKDHRPCSYYELLGVPPSADEKEIASAIHLRRDQLQQELQGEHARTARHILKELQEAEDCLLRPDTDNRAQYDQKLSRLDSEHIAHETTSTHDALANVTPTVMQRFGTSYRKVLSTMRSEFKRRPVIAATITGVAAGAAGVFYAITSNDSPDEKKPRAAAQKKLPADAPELQQPLPSSIPSSVPPEETVLDEPSETPEEPLEPPPLFRPDAPAEPAPDPLVEREPVVLVTPAILELTEEPTPIEPTPPKRRAAPTDKEMEPYSELLQSPTLHKQSIEDLLVQVQRSEKPIEQWILLQIALEKARGENNLDDVMNVLAEMQRLFDVDDMVMEQSATAVQNAAQQKGGNVEQVMTHSSGIARGLCAQDDFAGAKRFLASLRSRPSANAKECADMLRVVSQLQKTYDAQGIAGHQQALAENPDDSEANQAVGAYRCLEQGDWSFSTALQTQKGSALGNLAARVDQRDTLPATDLHQLAQDLVSADMAGPGAVAMAVHCLELAEPKAGSAIITARIKDMKRNLLRDHAATLTFFRGAPLHPPAEVAQAQTGAPDVRVDVPGALPPGAVNLLGEDVKELIKKGFIVRDRWQAANEGDTQLLQGTSGTQSWVASLNLPLSPESQKIVQSGQYSMRWVFKRTPDGRWNDALQGATAFAIPLPNGQSLSLYWDANMDPKNLPSAYRSGFDIHGTPFFGPRRDAPAFTDHARPVVSEDGLEYVCQVAVRSMPGGYAISAQVAGRNDTKPIAQFNVTAPQTVKSDAYLFEQQGKRMPANQGAPWGVGVGGGTIQVREAQILPLQPNRQARTLSGIGLSSERKTFPRSGR